MIKFKFSLFYIAVLLVLNPFHSGLERTLYQNSSEKFIFYVLAGLFVSFFLIIFWKVITARKNSQTAVLIFISGMIFFFMTSTPRIGFKIGIFEFFLLGVLLAIEDKRIKLWVPLLLIVAAAVLVEVTTNIFINQGFFYNDIWRSSLFGLGGYVSIITYRRM